MISPSPRPVRPGGRPSAPRAALLASLVVLALAGPAAGQDEVILARQTADVTVAVVLGAEQTPAHAARVTVTEEGAMPTILAEATDVDGEVVFGDQQILAHRPYLVTAWVDGVPYHARERGQVFLDGGAARVQAFPLGDDRAGIRVTGMNLVVREQGDGFALEYVCQVQAAEPPRQTVAAAALPLRLRLPEALTRREATIRQGPEPQTAPLRPAADGLVGVAAPLKPGSAKISVTGFLPAADPTRLTVELDVPVEQWSLLAWPAELRVESFDLRRDGEGYSRDFARWQGPALQPGDAVDVALGATGEVAAAPVFADTSSAAPASAPDEPAPDRRFPWLTVIAAVVLLGGFVVWRLRR